MISTLDTCAANLEWDDGKTAQKASQALTGKSKVWFDNVIKESPEVGKDWQLLKSRLQIRFGNIMSLAERVKALQALNQGPLLLKLLL